MNALRKAAISAEIFRVLLAALLLALSGSPLLAQQPAPVRNDLQRLRPGTVFRDCVRCPEMVVVPPGSVTVGPADDGAERMGFEEPRYTLTITRAIGVGRYEVTRGQFARFVQESGHKVDGGCFVWNGSRYLQDASRDWRNPGFAQKDNEPVVCVNWNDAKAYSEWLTKTTGEFYRLPTEEEWEYAARAGSLVSRPWGDKPQQACRYANVADTSAKRGVAGTVSWEFHECNDHHAHTAPVGSYPPNAFGLYDMLGNAWEWTEDCWSDENGGAPGDDPDWLNKVCSQRVLRGGAWVDSPTFVSYDFRFFIGSRDRDFYAGFRVVRAD
jgi:formylglycine-generating enzyme required for sulfatase activity